MAGPLNDHVEHIRTIHFALLLSCFGMLVAASSPRAERAHRAIEQLDAVSEIARLEPGQIEDAIEAELRDLAERDPTTRTAVLKALDAREAIVPTQDSTFQIGDRDPNPLCLSLPRRNWFSYRGIGSFDRTKARREDAWFKYYEEYFFNSLPAPFHGTFWQSSLGEFSALWDELDTKLVCHVVTGVSTHLYRLDAKPTPNGMEGPLHQVPYSTDRKCSEWLPVAFEFAAAGYRLKEQLGDSASHWVMHLDVEGSRYDVSSARGREGSYIVPVARAVMIPHVDAQLALLRAVNRPHWPRGVFQNCFPELAAYRADYASVPLRDLRNMLHREEELTRDRYEVFGTKVSPEAVALWGALGILAIQLYFLIHLTALAAKTPLPEEAMNIAWIGLYSTPTPTAVYVLSVCLLPAAAVILAAAGVWRSASGGIPWLYGAQVVASVALGLLSLRPWLQLRRRSSVPPSRSP